jgi:hypothetical protein
MPDVTVTLTDEENSDLEAVAENMAMDRETAAHDLLVSAIADAVEQLKPAPSQSYDRGVKLERRRAEQANGQRQFAEGFGRTMRMAVPSRRR